MPGFRLVVDLDRQTVSTTDGSKSYKFAVDPSRRHSLLNGLDEIGLTLRHADKIRAFEARRQAQFPGCSADRMKIAVLPGDGIGKEIVAEALRVLGGSELKFELEEAPVGGAGYEARPSAAGGDAGAGEDGRRDPVRRGRRSEVRQPAESSKRPEQAILGLRKELGLFANLRPAQVYAELADASSLRPEVVAGLDILIVRELTGDIYFGQPKGIRQHEAGEPRRLRHHALHARRRSAASRASPSRRRASAARRCARSTRPTCSKPRSSGAKWSPRRRRNIRDVELIHMYVDNCAMQLVRNPKQFDVIVTGNMFGDILSDEASMLTGSIGMLPSASLDANNKGLYEPIHGSAPDIAGKGVANPLATILSAAMMLRHSLNQGAAADRLEAAVRKMLRDGYRTADIYTAGTRKVGTAEMASAVAERL